MFNRDVKLLFPKPHKGLIKMIINLDNDRNQISVAFYAVPKHFPRHPSYYENLFINMLSEKKIEKLFNEIKFRIKEDLLIRSNFTQLEINFTHNSKLNFSNRNISDKMIDESLDFAKNELLANAHLTKGFRCCII